MFMHSSCTNHKKKFADPEQPAKPGDFHSPSASPPAAALIPGALVGKAGFKATERPGPGERTLLTAHFRWSTGPLEVQSIPGCKHCLWHGWLHSFKDTLWMSQTDSSRGQGFLRVQDRQNVQVARPGGQGCSLSRWGAAEGVTVGLKPAQAPCWNSVSKETKRQKRKSRCHRRCSGRFNGKISFWSIMICALKGFFYLQKGDYVL